MTAGVIAVDGGELGYEMRGSGAPVVLLHGGLLDSRMWDAQFAELAEHHTVVRYDARGHGRSSTPTAPFSPRDDLDRLLTGLDIPGAALVALSGGGRIAIDYAIHHPERVDRLVLVASGIEGRTHRDPFILDQNERLLAAGAAGDLATAVECTVRMWVDGPYRAAEETPAEVRALCHRMYTDTIERHVASGVVLAEGLTGIDGVGEIQAPTRALVGDLDSCDIHDVADLVCAGAKDARKVVVPGVGHMINMEAPAAFARELAAGLR